VAHTHHVPLATLGAAPAEKRLAFGRCDLWWMKPFQGVCVPARSCRHEGAGRAGRRRRTRRRRPSRCVSPRPHLDAIYLKLRPTDEPAEGVLVAWGITLEGQKVLLGLQLGSRESYESWLDFGRDLTARGMCAPALIVADGAPGIWKATRELWQNAAEQRCTVHAFRNITVKLPSALHREVKARYWQILDDAISAAEANTGLLALAGDYRTACPSAMRVIDDHIDQLVAHLRFPLKHRKRTRSTNG